jgi:hypothetical protein
MLSKIKKKINSSIRTYTRDRKIAALVSQVLTQKLSYLEDNALYDLSDAVKDVEKKKIEGCIVETGCALGGSSIILAAAKNGTRELFCYDVFGTIPEPSSNDGDDVHARYEVIVKGESSGIGGDLYYGYQEDLYGKVVQNFKDFGIEPSDEHISLVKGLYQDTLHLTSPVCLAHIDCDWYESVFLSLERIEPFVVSGGIIIIDDYYAYTGCKKAVDEYFKDRNDCKFINKSRLHIIKQ